MESPVLGFTLILTGAATLLALVGWQVLVGFIAGAAATMIAAAIVAAVDYEI